MASYQYLIYFVLFITFHSSTSDSIDDNRDDDSGEDSMEIPTDLPESNNTITCARKQNSLMHEILQANPKQFPFVVALMSQRNEYICTGSIIANGMILTAAECTSTVSHVLLNTTMDKKDETNVQLHVIKTDSFPTYTGPDSPKNVAILYTEKHNNTLASKIRISNFTNPQKISEMEAIGFGLNSEVGHSRPLQYVGVERRSAKGDIMHGYLDCIETKILTCFKDIGGPVIFDNELIGIITRGQNDCTKEIMPNYAINKRLVDVLPTFTFKSWLDEQIAKNQEQVKEPLEVYPTKLVFREPVLRVLKSKANVVKDFLTISIVLTKYLFS
ncbi:trypsin-like [Leptidea sinapis]|uniref:trypsin-like n=1 Tax=Leptidea sinapis TaxID=189913 RepID=UPI0021C34C1A|nr:trypsin-like [Leptidea sinapis]